MWSSNYQGSNTSGVRWCEAMFAYENWHHLVRPEHCPLQHFNPKILLYSASPPTRAGLRMTTASQILRKRSCMNDLSLRALAASLAVFLPPKFRGPRPAICAFLAHLWELKAGAESGTQNCASESKIFSFTDPNFGRHFWSPFWRRQNWKKSGRNPRQILAACRRTAYRITSSCSQQVVATFTYVIVASYKN